jgi:hypothetical protein
MNAFGVVISKPSVFEDYNKRDDSEIGRYYEDVE